MKRKLELSTFCLIFLALFSLIKAQDLSPPHRNLEESLVKIKIQKFYYGTYYGLFAQFGTKNPYTPLLLNMRSGLTWVNNLSYKARNNHYYDCSESSTCTSAGPFTTQEGDQTISGTLVDEQMAIAGLSFPSIRVLIADEVPMADKNAFPGSIGLSFKQTKSNANLHTIYDYFRLDSSSPPTHMFSLFIDNNEGELIFGGYDAKKAENKFQKVPLLDDTDLSIEVKSLSLNGAKSSLATNSKAILDLSTPFIMVPPAIMTKVKQDITSQGLESPQTVVIGRFGEVSIDCKAISVLKDLQIELNGETLNVPASSYIRVQYDVKSSGITAGCFLTLAPWDDKTETIILGEPFLKTFYSVFDGKEKEVSFSQINAARAVYGGDTSSPSPIAGIIFLIIIAGCLYFFIKKYQKPGTGLGSGTSLFNSGTRIGGGPTSTAGRDRWRYQQELSDSLGENETHP